MSMHSKGFAATVSLSLGLVLILLGTLGSTSGPALATDQAQGPALGATVTASQILADGEIVLLTGGRPMASSGAAGDGSPADSLAGLRKGEGLRARDEATVTGPAAVTAGIADGGFESGADGSWQEYSYQGWPIILWEEDLLSPPHRGRWAAWLGGDDDELSYVEQTITVPSNQADAILSFWLWIASQDDACGLDLDHDFFFVGINGTAKAGLPLCITNNTGGWVKFIYEMPTYAGQSLALQLGVYTNASLNSNAFLDDVAFEALLPPLTRAHLPLVQRGKPAVQTFAPSCSASNGYCEPFNTWRDAYGPLKPGAAYSAYPNDQTDYYYFTVEQRRSVTIQITNYQANGQMLIRDEQLAELAKDVNVPPGWDGTMTVSGLDLQPGRYFIQLFTTADHNQDHRYTLTVTQ